MNSRLTGFLNPVSLTKHMNMKKIIVYNILMLITALSCAAQIRINGRVLTADGEPLIGATVKIKDHATAVLAGDEGKFSIAVNSSEPSLIISFIGFRTVERKLILPLTEELIIRLDKESGALDEVLISTGYQTIPKERASGSFVQVDKQQINRRVSTDVLSRLEDMVPGLTLNRKGASQISIRGQSTLYSNAEPLIVIDNFPYEGDLANINPNDVESITILKDAAAASIWGARAGNGVIVITTSKGRFQQPTKFTFNSNITAGDKPDLFYQPRISSADFIGVEQMLFNKGYYLSTESSLNKTPLTPAVELLIAKRDGLISGAEADSRIEALKNIDVRRDIDRYMYRNSLNQQHSLNLSGGTENQTFFVSAGYDRNLQNLVANSYDRLSFNGSNTYRFLKQKLQLRTGIYYIQSKQVLNNAGPGSMMMDLASPMYPYARLADDQGNPLSVIRDYRAGYVQNAAVQVPGLLDWTYSPIREIELADNKISGIDYRINANIQYKLPAGFDASLLYQYGKTIDNSRNLQGIDTYYTRNLINSLTSVVSPGTLVRPVPVGGILDMNTMNAQSHNLRAQLNYNRVWKDMHRITALAGAEVQDRSMISNSSRLYGYDDLHASSLPVDHITPFTTLFNPNRTSTIPAAGQMSELTDRYLSWYMNGAYTLKNKYTLTASGRFDKSNLFGVRTNQKGVPLWSAGLAYNLSDESFYKISYLPYLKLRLSYGYNGNVNRSLSAYTTARYVSAAFLTRIPYASVSNPPNPELRWERIKMVNAGIDFSSAGNILSGSIDFFSKKGFDLIGETPFPPSSGITRFRGNTAGIRGNGIDIALSSRNIDRKFKWYSHVLFGFSRDEVTDYRYTSSAINYAQSSDGLPFPGNPIYGMYSYPWGGLSAAGDPQGYLGGTISTDYAQIISKTSAQELVFHGPSRPAYSGALRNTLEWKGIGLSANISYRLGYYFRRASVNYSSLLRGIYSHGDYAFRWQKSGDEQSTSIPSIPAAVNSNRDQLYLYSEALVEKGDHIRLQDINLSYELTRAKFQKLPFSNAKLYIYANNLGLIWQANKSGLDPDYQSGPPPRTIAAGLIVDFK